MTAIQQKTQLHELALENNLEQTLIRLPYRIGYWVSQSDQTGGNQSDDVEQQALEGVILSYGEDVCKSEFTQSVMEKTIAGYDLWHGWRENIEIQRF